MYMGYEPISLLLMPFASDLAGAGWRIINDMNLLFISLLVVVIRESFEARAQGADEGNAAVLAYKRVEKHAWWFLFVILLFAIPTAPQKVVSKNYSCNSSRIESSEAAKAYADLNYVAGQQLVSVESPMMFGLINNTSQTLFGALRGAMYCGSDSKLVNDVNEVNLKILEDKPLEARVATFSSQCHAPAIDKINALDPEQIEDEYKENHVTDAYKLFFSSPQMLSVYRGDYVIGGQASIKAEVKSTIWPYGNRGVLETRSSHEDYSKRISGNLYGHHNPNKEPSYLTMTCDSLARVIQEDLENHIDIKFSTELDGAAESILDYDQTGMSKSDAKREARGLYVQRLYDNTISRAAGALKVNKFVTGGDGDMVIKNNSIGGGLTMAEMKAINTASYEAQSGAVAKVGYFVASITNIFKSTLETHAIFMYAGIILAFCQAIVFIATPFVITMSGMSSSSILNVAMIMFYFAGLGYMLEIAFAMTSTLNALGSTIYGEMSANRELAILMSGIICVTASIGTWTSICGSLGMKLGPLVQNVIGGMSAVGTRANEMAKTIASGGMGKAASFASKAAKKEA